MEANKLKTKIICIMLSIPFFGYAQEKSPLFTMGGGVWFGMNTTTRFVGFIGPKISTTFQATKNLKTEIGLNGVPGLILGKDAKPALSLGSTVTMKWTKSKVRPVFGVMFLKTNTWQMLYGVGVLF